METPFRAPAGGALAVEEPATIATAFRKVRAGEHAEAARLIAEFLGSGVEVSDPAMRSEVAWAYLEAQVGLPESERPSFRRASRNLRRNLEALALRNPELAEEVRGAARPHLEVVQLWRDLRFFDRRTGKVAAPAADFPALREKLAQHGEAILFGGILSGTEVAAAARSRPTLFHGALRTVYLVEPDLERAQALLLLEDLSDEIEREGLVLFAGANWLESLRRTFASGRYAAPRTVLGDEGLLEPCRRAIEESVAPGPVVDAASKFSESAEFRRRRVDIAAGRIQPRVLCITSRFTTFLRFSTAEFHRAFARLGCESRVLIEETDGQRVVEMTSLKDIASFRPDVVFLVSHARPILPHLPRALPVVSYVQDKTGPLFAARDLGSGLGPGDLFLCMTREFMGFLGERGVGADRLFYEPTPADDEVFRPLGPDHPRAEAYRCDVSFVKHGFPGPEAVFEEFRRLLFQEGTLLASELTAFWRRVAAEIARKPAERHYEDEFRRRILSAVRGDLGPKERSFLEYAAMCFNIQVYSSLLRGHYIETLSRAGFDLRLHGNRWAEHPTLGRHARGAVDHESELNSVYNFSRINLNFHHNATLHQRIMQGGLAGAFFLVLSHDAERDWAPLTDDLVDGRHLVLFSDPEDLVEKCRYYLAHEEERRAIGERLRERVLAAHSTIRVAERAIERLRERLREAGDGT